MKSFFWKSTLSLVAVATASPAWAQDADADGSTITVVGDLLGADQSNASVSVIDAAAIRRAQNGAAADLIARLPGVSITQYGTLGSVSNVRIRGAEGEQTLVVIDGVRVGDPSSPGGGFDFANLMLGAIDRIEVLRGANSLPWGSQAIGGVVAISTTEPDTVGGGTSGRIGAEYGARDTARVNGQLRADLGTAASISTASRPRPTASATPPNIKRRANIMRPPRSSTAPAATAARPAFRTSSPLVLPTSTAIITTRRRAAIRASRRADAANGFRTASTG